MGKFDKEFIETCEKINFIVCLVIIIGGLIGNLTIVLVLKCELKDKKNFAIEKRSTFISSSILYILTLAISDSIFLCTHLIEDILPSISNQVFLLQLVNRSNLFCKLIIYFRNSTRIISSYLIAFYACERFMVIHFAAKRALFQNKKFTIGSIVLLALISHVLTSYSLFINGIRHVEQHEMGAQKFECDVLEKYKNIYDYIIFVYTLVGIMVPIFLVVFFNLFIVKILLVRKRKSLNMDRGGIVQLMPKSQSKMVHIELKNRAEMSLKSQAKCYMTKKNLYSEKVATVVLILFSVCFVVLNLPYILTWSLFYVPFKQGLLPQNDIYFRYSFVLLTETLHLTNFSINVLLYSVANKRFRQRVAKILKRSKKTKR
ncbi:thyrotropin-releasing hormone receptor-like [Brachionus plicatilis]|uniref:Thyrotropin-releasing hormone receptor-like n=1 Tax=Brachionus plicatilis TaxID=10195 RepID=A0A3M7S8I7_BRAPC|nr:thyrotropin-releasing hormone receptor-like [Brachionus plicatilis]